MPPTITETIIPTPSTSPETSSSSSVNVGAIVGGLIAGIVAACALAALGYFLLIRRCKLRRGTSQSHDRRERAVRNREPSEGSHPLLYPITHLGLQVDYNPYLDDGNTTLPMSTESPMSPSSPAHTHPLPHNTQQHYGMMHEIPGSESPPRPSLPPLVIPPTIDESLRAIVPSTASSASSESMSAYSQASASTRLHHSATVSPIPPVPPIPFEFITKGQGGGDARDDTSPTLIRGNTQKLSRLLKSRARRARGGNSASNADPLTRSSTVVSHIERSNSILSSPSGSPASANVSLSIRNPFDTHSRSPSVTTLTNTSIANHTPHWHNGAQRLSVIDNEDAEMDARSVYGDVGEISSPIVPATSRRF